MRPSWTVGRPIDRPRVHVTHACLAVIAGLAPGGGGAHVALMIGMVLVVGTGVAWRPERWLTTRAATRTARASTTHVSATATGTSLGRYGLTAGGGRQSFERCVSYE